MLKYVPNAEFLFKKMKDATTWVATSAVINFVGFVLMSGLGIQEITTHATKYFFLINYYF
jgi:hypothetical protein